MEEQVNRINYEIMDEVCARLAEEGPSAGIDPSTLYTLQTEWIKNLERIQEENAKTGGYRTSAVVRGDNSSETMTEDGMSSSQGSELDELERRIESYMMCLFIKVAKSKNKWKCSFKHGFISLGQGDMPFNTAIGELEW